MKRVIYFDVDHTLLDSSKLGRLFYEQISKETGLSIEELGNIEKKYRASLKSHTDFYPADFLEFVYKYKKMDFKQAKPLFDDKKLYERALFPETKEILENLKNTYRLGIFSEGFDNYQIKKLNYSGIAKYFDKNLIIISRRKMDYINKIETGSIVVDDDKEVIKELKNYSHFETLWLNRKNDEEKIENVAMINNLENLLQ